MTATCPPGPALDVGCGTGALAERLAAAGYEVTGVDPSVGMLEVLRGRCDAVNAVQASGTELPFDDDSFELVLTVATMHHIATPGAVRRTLAEMVRVSRPGGRIVIWDHNPRNPYWSSLMGRVPQDTGEERLIPEAEIVDGLQLAGALTAGGQGSSGWCSDFHAAAAAGRGRDRRAPGRAHAVPARPRGAQRRARDQVVLARLQLGDDQPVSRAGNRVDREAAIDLLGEPLELLIAAVDRVRRRIDVRVGAQTREDAQRAVVDQQALPGAQAGQPRSVSLWSHSDGTRPSSTGSPMNIEFVRPPRIRISTPRSGSTVSTIRAR